MTTASSVESPCPPVIGSAIIGEGGDLVLGNQAYIAGELPGSSPRIVDVVYTQPVVVGPVYRIPLEGDRGASYRSTINR